MTLPIPEEAAMDQTTQTMAPLSPHWAFVVQLREGTALTPDGLHGRVEHIVSSQAGFFTSLKGLLEFMAQVPTLPGQAPDGAESAGSEGGPSPPP